MIHTPTTPCHAHAAPSPTLLPPQPSSTLLYPLCVLSLACLSSGQVVKRASGVWLVSIICAFVNKLSRASAPSAGPPAGHAGPAATPGVTAASTALRLRLLELQQIFIRMLREGAARGGDGGGEWAGDVVGAGGGGIRAASQGGGGGASGGGGKDGGMSLTQEVAAFGLAGVFEAAAVISNSRDVVSSTSSGSSASSLRDMLVLDLMSALSRTKVVAHSIPEYYGGGDGGGTRRGADGGEQGQQQEEEDEPPAVGTLEEALAAAAAAAAENGGTADGTAGGTTGAADGDDITGGLAAAAAAQLPQLVANLSASNTGTNMSAAAGIGGIYDELCGVALDW